MRPMQHSAAVRHVQPIRPQRWRYSRRLQAQERPPRRRSRHCWRWCEAASSPACPESAWRSHGRAGSAIVDETCLRCCTGIFSATTRALLRAETAPQATPAVRSAQRRRRRSRFPRIRGARTRSGSSMAPRREQVSAPRVSWVWLLSGGSSRARVGGRRRRLGRVLLRSARAVVHRRSVLTGLPRVPR